MDNLAHYGDIIAIPFFLYTFYYFYRKENKKIDEIILMLFVFGGLIADIYFTYCFLINKNI